MNFNRDKYSQYSKDNPEGLKRQKEAFENLRSKFKLSPLKIDRRPQKITTKVSVIIPVKNGGEQLGKLLGIIRSQKRVAAVEIIVIDSASTDNSVKMAKGFGAKVIPIPQGEFNHGRTRNLGAEKATGEYLVFTVQDAVPINNYWLYSMICPFIEHQNLAAASSRQFVKPEADLLSLWMNEGSLRSLGFEGDSIYSLLDEASDILWRSIDSNIKRRMTYFDNVSSCVRKSVFEEVKFSHLNYAEDIDFAMRLIERGMAVGYLPSTGVYHWHDRGADYELKHHYVGSKAEVKILKNEVTYFFKKNNLTWGDLLKGIEDLYGLINSSIHEMKDIDPDPVKTIRLFVEAFKTKREVSVHREALKWCGITEPLDFLLTEVLADNVSRSTYPCSLKRNPFIPEFINIFSNFSEYLSARTGSMEGREFISCVYKIFGMTAGRAFASFWLEAEADGGIFPELERVDHILGRGVSYF